MKWLSLFTRICETLEGAIDAPPPRWQWLQTPLVRGLWWGLLIVLILFFCGQTSKFIYIDF